jgi:hypothetical protein
VGNEEGILRLTLEETVSADFNLGSNDEYVDVGDVDGRLLIEPHFNRGAMLEVAESTDNPPALFDIKKFINDWDDIPDDNIFQILYGKFLFRGAEPLDMPSEITISIEESAAKIQSRSPDEIRNALRQEIEYSTTYEQIETQVEQYLDKNGISVDQVDIGVPIHIRAKAESFADDADGHSGVRYDFTLKNMMSDEDVHVSKLAVDMPAEIARGVKIAKQSDVETGDFNPERNAYEWEVGRLPANKDKEVKFKITQKAKGELNNVEGELNFEKNKLFSDISLQGFFDAGGRRGDASMLKVDTTGTFVTTFSANSSDIMLGGKRDVNKKFEIKGITPTSAMETIGETLKGRGLGADRENLKKGEQLSDDSIEYGDGGFKSGTVMRGETKIKIDVAVKGRQKLAQKQRGSDDMESDETLPDIQRQTTTEYGQTGVRITAYGNNLKKVDEYATELRREIQMELEGLAEEI